MFFDQMDQGGEWLIEALCPIFQFKKCSNMKFEKLIGPMGYMSEIRRVIPSWEGENLPKSLIVKIPTFSVDAEKAIDNANPDNKNSLEERNNLVRIFHRNESKFYRIFQTWKNPPVPIPRIYLNRDSDGVMNDEFSVIVMEDLGMCSTVDIVDGFNDKQLYALVDALVDLHIYSFTNSEWKAIGFFDEEMKGNETMESLVQTLAVRLKITSERHFEKLELLLKLAGADDWNEHYGQSCRNGELLNTFAHGDLWPANILWEGNKLRAIIDWQLSHCGSILEDLMKVLATSVTVETRERLTKPVLRYYYDQLKSKMAKFGQKLTFTFEDVEETYRLTLPYTALTAVFSASFWSNSAVLKDETNPENEKKRINEIFDRTKNIIEETVQYLENSK